MSANDVAQGTVSRSKLTGIALSVGSSLSNNTGSGIGALAFPAIGPIGVVAVRQLVMAVSFLIIGRVQWHRLSKKLWPPIVGMAVVFGLMSVALYMSLERIDLGLAITLQFLGPFGLVVVTSRRKIDVFCILLAMGGVILLVNPGATSDLLGIALALVAALCWASYILLNRHLGAALPGLQGTAVASIVSTAAWIPIAIYWFSQHPPVLWAIGLAICCGLLSSVVTASFDLLALRRLSMGVFSTLTSLNPVWAALVGLFILQQTLSWNEWTGIGLVVISNVIVTATNIRQSIAPPAHEA